MPVHLSRGGLRPVAAVALASACLVTAAASGSIFLSTALHAWTAIAAPGPAGPADGILLMAGLGGTLLSLWLGLGMTLSALSALPGALGHLCRRLAHRVAPAVVRKAVAFILGTTLSAALMPGTALAGIGHEAGREAVVTTARQSGHTPGGVAVAAPDASFRLVGGRSPVRVVHGTQESRVSRDKASQVSQDMAPPPSWSTERTASRVPGASRVHPGPRVRPAFPTSSSSPDTVVVLRGDTLWSIAARHLGPAARAAEIDIEWHRWLAANRDVIGDDADLILPGQLLRPPPSPGAGS
jgi:LysM domain